MRSPDGHTDYGPPRISEEQFMAAARQYVSSAYPNPERLGCPGRPCLEVVARRHRRPSSEEIEHITRCSPCFIEYQALRREWKRRRLLLTAGSIAAGLSIIFTSLVFVLRHTGATVSKPPQQKTVELAKAVSEKRLVDLRPYESERGDQTHDANRRAGPLIFGRAIFDLTIQLPVGAEEGKYLFDLIDPSGVQRLEVSGQATIIDYVTTAQATVDLRGLSPGMLTLAVRRADHSKLISCPIQIR